MPVDKINDENDVFDVCIIGAGPAGLATLSALHAPYSLDGGIHTDAQRERALKSLHRKPRLNVCIVDPHKSWLCDWKQNFDRLSISHLRSPVLAHPDLFDPNALLTYAVSHGRQEELLESGCGDLKDLHALGQTQVGLWKLPSTKLFIDFCEDLAQSPSLPHTFLGGSKVVDIVQHGHKAPTFFELILETDNIDSLSLRRRTVTARAVVLAVGPSGYPIVPPSIEKAPRWRYWNQSEVGSTNSQSKLPILVVGGGLTAVQVALKEVTKRQGKQSSVILCSKTPLVEKHFDIGIEWFDHRTTNKHMADHFYDRPMEERSVALKEARQGGSIPPLYMNQVREAERIGTLKCVVGSVQYDATQEYLDMDHGMTVRVHLIEGRDGKDDDAAGPVSFRVNDIIVACGIRHNCGADRSTLIGKIQSQWPTRREAGLPCITQDLRWRKDVDLFVVGTLASLNGGPDAGNLMGMRRAAQIVANALDCRCWLHETALVNPFDVFASDDSTSDEDESEDGFSNEEEYAANYKEKVDGECTEAETMTMSACS